MAVENSPGVIGINWSSGWMSRGVLRLKVGTLCLPSLSCELHAIAAATFSRSLPAVEDRWGCLRQLGYPVLDPGHGAEGYEERFAKAIRYALHVSLTTSAARCLEEQVRHQAATVVKTVPRLESLIRSLLGQAS